MNMAISPNVRRSLKEGMSLIEIMIVILIIGLITGVVGPALMGRYRKAQKTTAKSTIRSLKTAITNYQLDIGQYPSRLRDLVKKPTDEAVAKKWDEKFLEADEVPRDPWGNNFVYKVTGKADKPYELYSYGPSGKGAPKSEHISVWD